MFFYAQLHKHFQYGVVSILWTYAKLPENPSPHYIVKQHLYVGPIEHGGLELGLQPRAVVTQLNRASDSLGGRNADILGGFKSLSSSMRKTGPER